MARDDENQQQALGAIQSGAAQSATGKENLDACAREQTLDELMDLTYSGERQEQALAEQALQAKVTAPHKILVVGASWVGDMLMAQSLFILLKRTRPDCHITVLAPAWTKPLLARMPEVDETLELPFDHGELKLGARRRFGKSLASAGYTHAIVLPNSFKSALIPRFAGIKQCIGWRGEARGLLLNDCRYLDKAKYPRMVERFAALAFPANKKLPDQIPDPRLLVSRPMVDKALAKFGIETTGGWPKRLIAICPGAEFGASKQWPADHFSMTSARLVADGWRVVIMGSAGDAAIAEEIYEGIEKRVGHPLTDCCFNLTGKTSLAEAIDLMAACTLALSNDSGLMHVASAVDLSVVALYGSTSSDFTPPLASISRVLTTPIDCRPCFDRECRFGHKRCMTEIEPHRAVAAVLELYAK
jgi:heptosyltransferase-2